MDVIAHDREGQAIDGKDAGEELESLSNPTTSMFEGLASQSISSTKEGLAYAALRTENHLDLSWINHLTTSLTGHLSHPQRMLERLRLPNP